MDKKILSWQSEISVDEFTSDFNLLSSAMCCQIAIFDHFCFHTDSLSDSLTSPDFSFPFQFWMNSSPLLRELNIWHVLYQVMLPLHTLHYWVLFILWSQHQLFVPLFVPLHFVKLWGAQHIQFGLVKLLILWVPLEKTFCTPLK